MKGTDLIYGSLKKITIFSRLVGISGLFRCKRYPVAVMRAGMKKTWLALAFGLIAASGYGQEETAATVLPPNGHFQNMTGKNYSGWRGGIGIAFGRPGEHIPDVSELGYEVAWGGEQPAVAKNLRVAVFRYMNGTVECSLKSKNYDFSGMPDKDEAARLAFDAFAENLYGIKGLSKFANVKYSPKGNYGDVKGTMDLNSENTLTNAIINTYEKWFTDNGINFGGIGIDNFANWQDKGNFLSMVKKAFNPKGLGIAVNCHSKKLLGNPYLGAIDVAGSEGFEYSIDLARDIRAEGFNGIFCEFMMQHMSSAELSAYLKSKLFYGIVFFGYTDGGTGAGTKYSFYARRPDVYNHHRWVFRKYLPVSKALCKVGGQKEPYAALKSVMLVPANPAEKKSKTTWSRWTSSGVIYEKEPASADMEEITGMSTNTPGAIFLFGDNINDGVYYFISSPRRETVSCDARKLKLDPDTKIFDEFNERMIEGNLTDSEFTFSVEGPSVVQLGSKACIAKNLVRRMEAIFAQEDLQKTLETAIGFNPIRKAWALFCDGWTLDGVISRSGKASMKTVGGKYDNGSAKWKYYNRQGGAQFVNLDQKKAVPITLRAWSKSDSVPSSPFTAIDSRRAHFVSRIANIYAMHLYLDYQDGNWPEIHTVAFSEGGHDWEERVITVNPEKPVKTAMVLLEFLQPEGTAWFDDISLVQGTDGTNLLAYSSFENNEMEKVNANSVRKNFEAARKDLLDMIEKAGTMSPVTSSAVAEIEKKAAVIENDIIKSGAASVFGRELRDLRDIEKMAKLSLEILNSK